MEKVKEFMQNDKKMYTAAIIALVIGFACWKMFSGGIPDNGGSINQVRAELESARAELDVANGKLAKSQSIADELQRTNSNLRAEVAELARENNEARELVNSLRSANKELAELTNRDSSLTGENLRLVRESQRELKPVRERGQTRD